MQYAYISWPSTKASLLAPASCVKFDAFPFHFFAICVFSFWQRLFSLKRKPEKARKWKINQVNGNIQSVSSYNRATQMAKPSAPPTQTYFTLPFPHLQTQFSRKSKCYDFSFFYLVNVICAAHTIHTQRRKKMNFMQTLHIWDLCSIFRKIGK